MGVLVMAAHTPSGLIVGCSNKMLQKIKCDMKFFHHFFRTVITVLELLAAVCLVRGGHQKIMAAVDNFKVVRMQPILQHIVL